MTSETSLRGIFGGVRRRTLRVVREAMGIVSAMRVLLTMVRRGKVRVAIVPIHLDVARARREKVTDKIASGNLVRHAQHLLDVFVEVLLTTVGDDVGDVGDGTGHEREGARFAGLAGLFREFGQECDLEIVKVGVQSRELPDRLVRHRGFDDIPVLVIGEEPSGYAGLDWVEKLLGDGSGVHIGIGIAALKVR